MEQNTVQTETTTQSTQPSMPTSALMTTLMALVENYIKDIVYAQVNEILLNHRTLKMIDEGFKDQIKEIAKDVAEEAISDHNDEEYHLSESHIDDKIESEVESRISDHDFDSQISEAVNDAINDFDFTDVITASIKDNITFTATINVD
jgi:hypothetical protein